MDSCSLLTRTVRLMGCWLLALTVPLASHAAGLSMDTAIGFGGWVHLEKWTPVTILMENRGRSTRGTLEILVTSGSEYRGDVFQTAYARELDLPYGSKKRCRFTILLRSVTHDVLIRFREGGDTRIAAAANLKNNVIRKDMAIVLDDGVSPDFLSSLHRQVFPVRMDPTHLPDTWYGYDGVRMTILNPAVLKQLDDRQFHAMEGWLGRGGYLITSAASNYGAFREDRMKRLLPVQINGHRRLSPNTALGTFSDEPLTGAEPLLIVDAEVKDSETVAATEEIPLVLQKRTGHGRVVFVSFDIQSPAFNRWAGRQDFWDKILALSPERAKVQHTLSDQQVVTALISSMPLRFPRFWPAALFLLIYTAGIGMLFKKAGTCKENRIRYTTLLLLGILVSSTAGGWYFWGNTPMNRPVVNSVTMINGTGRRLSGSGKYILGTYSTRNAELRVGFNNTAYPISHILVNGAGKKTPNPYTLIQSPAGQQILTDLSKWSHNLFRAETVTDLPLTARAAFHNNRLQLSIENNSLHTIQNGLLYFKKRFFPTGPIEAKRVKNIALHMDRFSADHETTEKELEALVGRVGANRDRSFFNTLLHRLMRALLPKIQATYPSNNEDVLFIGGISTDLMGPQVDAPGGRGKGMTLLEWKIPLEKTDEPSFSHR